MNINVLSGTIILPLLYKPHRFVALSLNQFNLSFHYLKSSTFIFNHQYSVSFTKTLYVCSVIVSPFPFSFGSVVCTDSMLSRSVSLLKSSNFARAFSSSLKSYPINGFFDAKSYAIVGASEKQGTLGYIISDNFYHKFQGKTYFVNPKGSFYFYFVYL